MALVTIPAWAALTQCLNFACSGQTHNYVGLLSHVCLVTFHFQAEILIAVMVVSSVASELKCGLEVNHNLSNGADTLKDWHPYGHGITELGKT